MQRLYQLADGEWRWDVSTDETQSDLVMENMRIGFAAASVLRAALCPPDAADAARKVLEQAREDNFVRCYCVYTPWSDIPNMARSDQWAVYVSLTRNASPYGGYSFGETEAEAITAAAAWVEQQRKPVVPEVEAMELNDIILELQSLEVKDIDRTHAARWHPYWLGVTLQDGTLLEANRDETVRHFFEHALREARARAAQ